MPMTKFPAVVDLSSLNGKNGFKIKGELSSDQSGYSVASAGDINGDGIADLIIGAIWADPNGQSGAGSSYIIFGKNEVWPNSLELSALDGMNGFKINGEASSDNSGYSVSHAGDINGDGFDDIIIGAYEADPNDKSKAGSSYIVFGHDGVWPNVLELSTLNGTNGFKVNGEEAGDYSGASVGHAGDINGDGFDDVIIGAYEANPNGKSNAGSSYVIFGHNNTWASVLELSTLDGENGFKINGVITNGYTGYSVSRAGDINDDGVDDLIVGSPSINTAYVIFGHHDAWTSVLDLSTLDGVNGVGMQASSGMVGHSVSGVGDVNGDGIADVVIGAYMSTPNGRNYAGSSYVVFGKSDAWSASFHLPSMNGEDGFKINGEIAGDYSGYSVSGAGDINDDGFDDIIIGAYRADPNGKSYAGSSYVIFGHNGTWPNEFELSALDGINGFKINGEVANDNSGFSISHAGDINGDGVTDVVIGAYGADPDGKSFGGLSYVIFGDKPESFDESDFEFTANQLTITEQETRLITLANLNATDAQHDDICFTITDLQYGRFENVSNPGTLIGDFSKAAITSNQIQFVHTDDIYAPAYSVIVHRSDKLASVYYSGAQAATITFTPVNDLPVLTMANGPISYVRNDLPTVIDSGMTIADIDHVNLTSAMIAITNNFVAGEDVLHFTNKNNIIGGYNNETGILTLTGNDTIANYQTALRSVKYQNILNELTSDLRTISFTVNDGVDDSAPKTRDVDVILSPTTTFLPVFELSSLSGVNGFKINGEVTDDQSGISISSAGDINGDGIDDIIIGAYYADPNEEAYAGSSYVIFGHRDTWVTPFELSTLDGANGFKINGEFSGDRSGCSVSSAGDINGDGFDDLIIGAYYADPNLKNSAGMSYVIFGKNGTWITPLELSTLDGENGFKINGELGFDYSGYAVSGAGDINGDGLSDIIIGAYGADPNGLQSGSCYVIFGHNETWSNVLELSALNGTNGFKINGEASYDWSGWAVSSAGDINDDGIDDIIIGAYGADPNGKSLIGSSYVIFGHHGAWATPLELSTLDGTNGFKINGEGRIASDNSGYSVSRAGDVNGDGIGDLIIGAPLADPYGVTSDMGSSYVIFGHNQTWTTPLELSTLNGANGSKIHGKIVNDRSGWSVSGAGDVNDDGLDDLIIGAIFSDPFGRSNAGSSYIVFGRKGNWPAFIDLVDLDGTNGFKVVGEVAEDESGHAVSHAGDINGDGISDIIISARYADPNGKNRAGASYVIFGNNFTPVLTGSGGSFDYVENDPATVIDNAITITDIDSINLTGATVSIITGFQSDADELIFENQNGITGFYSNATGVLTLTGSSSLANYQTALCSVKYRNILDNLIVSSRTIFFMVVDGAKNSMTITRLINIIPVNDLPVITVTSDALNYTEKDLPIVLDQNLILIDPDDENLMNATVTIANNFHADQDQLKFINQNGILGDYDDVSGILSLTGTSNIGNYQTALRNVTYENLSDNPATDTRTISFVVFDGEANSGLATRDIQIIAVNDLPVLTSSGDTINYTENELAKVIEANIVITDPDSVNLTNATIAITNNFYVNQDRLLFENQNGILGDYQNTTGVLTLTGFATLANYQTALRNITYENLSDNPTISTRTVSFTVSDGESNSLPLTRDIAITAVNDIPILTGSGVALSYTENAMQIIDININIADLDNMNLTNATVAITNNFNPAQDQLLFENQNGILGDYQNATGILTLTGISSVENYQTALSSIQYENLSDDPATETRTVTFQVSDGGGNSLPFTRDIDITAVNDPPVVIVTSTPLNYTEKSSPKNIDASITVTDVDDTELTSATISIANNFNAAQDVLHFEGQNGITGDYNNSTGILILTGATTVENYQAALRSIQYENLSENPTTGARGIAFTVKDNQADSLTVTRDITITPINDMPVLTGSSNTLNYTERDLPMVIDATIAITDVDNTNLTNATIAITNNFYSDQDQLAFTNQNGILGGYDNMIGVLTLTGSATVANYQAALHNVTYENLSDDPAIDTRTISFTINDGELNSLSITRDINVISLNNRPLLTGSGSAINYIENELAKMIDDSITITDPDNVSLINATVAITNNFNADQDRLIFENQNGIIGDYQNTTGVLILTGTTSLANYQTALRSIKYENPSDDPATETRAVSFAVNDGEENSLPFTRDITVTSINDIPVLTSNSTGLIYIENDAPKMIDENIIIYDSDHSSLMNATVAITNNFNVNQDQLMFENQNGILGNYQNTTGILTLTGSATLSNYQAALRSITYENLSDDPAIEIRTITFQVNDGEDNSLPLMRNIQIIAVNDAPIVKFSASALNYTEKMPPQTIDINLMITDIDNTLLTGATMIITNHFNSVQDMLWFEDQNGISGDYNSNTGILTLTGTASVENYQTALRSIQYENPSDNPTTDTRTLSITVNDGSGNSDPDTKNIAIQAINDMPVLVNNQLTLTEGDQVTLAAQQLSATDVDNNDEDLIFTVNNVAHGNFQSKQTNQTVVTFAQRDITQSNILFIHDGKNDAPSYTVKVSDGENETNTTSAIIDFTPVNDPPVIEKNELAITQGKRVFLTTNEMRASDEETPLGEITLMVNNIQHGYFGRANQSDVAITMFLQGAVIAGNQIQFIHDDSDQPPSYVVSANDGILTSQPSEATVHFVKKPSVGEDDDLISKLSAPVISGILGLLFLAIKIYLNRKAAKSLKKLMEETEVGTLKQQAEFQQNVIRPIFKALYDRINMKGCLGYTDDETMKRYLDAVTCVIDRIDEEGVDIRLNEMKAIEQTRIINTIVQETRKQFVLDYAFCSCSNLMHFFQSFFVPDLTPRDLEHHAITIAANVRRALQQRKQLSAKLSGSIETIELADVKVKGEETGALEERIVEAVRKEMRKEQEKEKEKENPVEMPNGHFGFFDQHDPADEAAIEGQPSANESSTCGRRISSPM